MNGQNTAARAVLKNVPACSVLLASLLLAACTVGPDYVRPGFLPNNDSKPVVYKEAAGWKVAEPNDEAIAGNWWQIYNDPQLNTLEEQVELSNQNLAASAALFRQAQALVQSYRASYFPVITANGSYTRNQPSANSTNSINGPAIRSTNNANLSLSWEADVWGRISRTLEAGRATAQATIGDLAAAKLSAQAELAQNYFNIRIADSQKKLLDETVQAYQQSLQVTRNRYEAGVVGKSDVVQAETLLKTTQVQAVDVTVQRAQLEHAIALLIGKPPSELTIPFSPLDNALPDVPVNLPSLLMERRSDIAAAERRMAAANAQIGVAKAAYFPTLSFTVQGGVQSNLLDNLFSWPSRIWSLGSAAALTVFDGGTRRALSDQAVAVYDQNVANYRQTVLTAFQEVEDSLAALRILREEELLQADALASARASQEYSMNQYKAGIINYLDVITVANTALTNERSLINLRGSQLVNSVGLVKALGGGWQDNGLTNNQSQR